MAISFELPLEIEQSLRRDFDNLDEAAKEAALIELYRQDKLTRYQLSCALGISRFEADAMLKKHNVTEDLPDAEELARDLAALRELIDR